MVRARGQQGRGHQTEVPTVPQWHGMSGVVWAFSCCLIEKMFSSMKTNLVQVQLLFPGTWGSSLGIRDEQLQNHPLLLTSAEHLEGGCYPGDAPSAPADSGWQDCVLFRVDPQTVSRASNPRYVPSKHSSDEWILTSHPSRGVCFPYAGILCPADETTWPL